MTPGCRDAGSLDPELWRLAARGDPDAFGQIFDRHADAVYNHIFRRTTNWSVAEDLTSAVFLQAWRRRHDVVLDRESALPWLLGTANNVLRNAARERRRYLAAVGRLAQEELAGNSGGAAGLAGGAHEQSLAGQDLGMAEIRAAVERLPRHERDVIELCIWSGLDQQAAAIALGIAVGTVKSRLHRARTRLSVQLGKPPTTTTTTAGRSAVTEAGTGPGTEPGRRHG